MRSALWPTAKVSLWPRSSVTRPKHMMPAVSPLSPKSFGFEATTNGMPAIIIQITEMLQSYMIWVGAVNADITSLSGSTVIEQLAATQGSLAKDWACAMAPSSVSTKAMSDRPLDEAPVPLPIIAVIFHTGRLDASWHDSIPLDLRGDCAFHGTTNR